jgi:holo-[acyl-carrier protein] synthase
VGTVVGIGVDVVDLARFAATLERTPTVRERLFTAGEATLSVESLAARFAAKEALMKALRVPQALPWHDIEIVTDDVGAPDYRLSGAAADLVGSDRAHLSLSHDTSVATAFVVLERCHERGDAPC